MRRNVRHWLHGVSAAFVGGGASAVVSATVSMGFSPDKFNLTSLQGFGHLCVLLAANFLFNGVISMFFYLKQSPLPVEEIEDEEKTNPIGNKS